MNTHLQSQYPEFGHLYGPIRAKQLDRLAQFLGEQFPNDRVLLAGDLNTTPDERLYGEHLLRLGTDLTTHARQEYGDGTQIDARTGARTWIDYVIARKFAVAADLVLLKNEAADVPYSDHHGLFVRIQYDGPNKVKPAVTAQDPQ